MDTINQIASPQTPGQILGQNTANGIIASVSGDTSTKQTSDTPVTLDKAADLNGFLAALIEQVEQGDITLPTNVSIEDLKTTLQTLSQSTVSVRTTDGTQPVQNEQAQLSAPFLGQLIEDLGDQLQNQGITQNIPPELTSVAKAAQSTPHTPASQQGSDSLSPILENTGDKKITTTEHTPAQNKALSNDFDAEMFPSAKGTHTPQMQSTSNKVSQPPHTPLTNETSVTIAIPSAEGNTPISENQSTSATTPAEQVLDNTILADKKPPTTDMPVTLHPPHTPSPSASQADIQSTSQSTGQSPEQNAGQNTEQSTGPIAPAADLGTGKSDLSANTPNPALQTASQASSAPVTNTPVNTTGTADSKNSAPNTVTPPSLGSVEAEQAEAAAKSIDPKATGSTKKEGTVSNTPLTPQQSAHAQQVLQNMTQKTNSTTNTNTQQSTSGAALGLGLGGDAPGFDSSTGGFGSNTGNGFSTNGELASTPQNGMMRTGDTNANSFVNYLNSSPRNGNTSATQMISVQIQKGVSGKLNAMTLHLEPADLGRVDIQLKFAEDGALKAHMFVEKPETLAMLQRDSQALQNSLQEAGIDLDDNAFSFNLKQDNEHAENDNNSGGTADQNGAEGTDLTDAQMAIETEQYISKTGVNLWI